MCVCVCVCVCAQIIVDNDLSTRTFALIVILLCWKCRTNVLKLVRR